MTATIAQRQGTSAGPKRAPKREGTQALYASKDSGFWGGVLTDTPKTDTSREELAAATRRVLDSLAWSLRTAEKKTGIHYATINNMASGKGGELSNVLRFALATGEDILRWSDMIGFDLRPVVLKVIEQSGDEGIDGPRAASVPRLVLKSGEVIEVLQVRRGQRSTYHLTDASLLAVDAVLRAVKEAAEPYDATEAAPVSPPTA